MSFKVKFPASRPGGTTPDGDWTYHHVLPWRYYYLCGYVLCMAYQYMVIMDNNASRAKGGQRNTGKAIADLASSYWDNSKKEVDKKSVLAKFGKDSWGFDFGAELDAVGLWRLTKGIVTGDANLLDAAVRNSGVFDPDVVARACLGPPFGGFWGINGGQRTDDPEELRERMRPRSSDLNWWTNLNAVGAALESFASAIQENLPASRELSITVKEDAWRVFHSAVMWLVQNNAQAPAFAVGDWGYKWHSTTVPIGLNEAYTGNARGNMSKAAKVFHLLAPNTNLAGASPTAIAASDFVRVTEGGKRDVLYFRNGEAV